MPGLNVRYKREVGGWFKGRVKLLYAERSRGERGEEASSATMPH